MFKEEFPPPITEAGGELQECLRERLGMSIPREAAELERLGKRIIVIKHRQEEFQCLCL